MYINKKEDFDQEYDMYAKKCKLLGESTTKLAEHPMAPVTRLAEIDTATDQIRSDMVAF